MAKIRTSQTENRASNKTEKCLLLIMVIVICSIILIMAFKATTPISDPYEYEFTAKLIDFKVRGSPFTTYLVFDNGRIIEFSRQGSITNLEIGAIYDVHKNQYYDEWRVYKIEE